MLKSDIINGAFSEMRISGLTVSPDPRDLELALRRLEQMMAEFQIRGICLGYNFQLTPDPSDETGVELYAQGMMDRNLAVRLIPAFNQTVPQTLFALANGSLSTISTKVHSDRLRQVQPPRRMPTGSGANRINRNWRRFETPQVFPPNECATNEITAGEINDYVESFQAYLGTEAIVSFTIDADTGLTIVSSSNNSPLINYRVKADTGSVNPVFKQVKIVVTTNTGRINEVIVNFEASDTTVLINA